jgi:hypothetical protein
MLGINCAIVPGQYDDMAGQAINVCGSHHMSE